MKTLIGLAAACMLAPAPLMAQTIGVAMPGEGEFVSVLSQSIESAARTSGARVDLVNASGDADTQIAQIRAFARNGVDAIIANLADGDTGKTISRIADDAGIPLVYVTVAPTNLDELPKAQTFIAPDEAQSGTLQTREVCRRLGGKGEVVVLMGALIHPAARARTTDVMSVLASPECSGIEVLERQSANWSRDQAAEQMQEWLNSDVGFDAVIANNDEMALGAIQSLSAAGKPLDDIVVAGIDATPEALSAMENGDLDVTVFQDAAGQGASAVDAAMTLIGGEDVPANVTVPSELVTMANLDRYLRRN